LLKSVVSYNTILGLSVSHNKWVNDIKQNFAHCISNFSDQPVTNLESEFIDGGNYWKFGWNVNTHRNNKNFSAKWSKRTYAFNNKGFLVGITSSDPNDKKMFEFENHTSKSVFDTVYARMMDFMQAVSDTEYLAIKLFCKEVLTAMSPIDPLDEEVNDARLTVVRNAINTQRTIRQELNDMDNSLETYMLLIDEDKIIDSEMQQAPFTNDSVDPDAFFHINGYYPEGFDQLTGLPLFQKDVTELLPSDNVENEFPTEDQIELEVTKEKIQNTIDQMIMLSEINEEMRVLNNDLAQDAAQVVDRTLDAFKHNFAEILIKHGEIELTTELNNKIINVI